MVFATKERNVPETSFSTDAMKTYADFVNAALENARTMQESYIKALESMAEAVTSPTGWAPTDQTISNILPGMSEDRMREMFHQMAGANLRGWEQAANMLQATPEWMRWPHKAPGSMMTEWFDQLNRAAETAEAPADVAPMAEPIKGAPDDLTAIKGVGKKLAAALNDLGVTHYADIAAWSKADADRISEQVGFAGRATRDKWRMQAKKLAKAAA